MAKAARPNSPKQPGKPNILVAAVPYRRDL